MLILAGFAVLAVIAVVLVVIFGGGSSGNSDLVASLEKHNTEFPTELAKGNKVGKDDAPVKITAYEDFQCPFCLKYTATQEGEVINELVKSGKVQLEYRNLPILGNESVSAAIGAQCAAEQDKFWQYHNMLFLTQAKAGQATVEKNNVGRFSDANLKQFASDLGLDRTKFDSCFDNRTPLDNILQQQREANSFGITGTPGFLVNGQPLGAGTPNSIDDWKQIVTNVENALATQTAQAGASPAATGSPAASPSAAASPTKAP
ncbi:MAG TPA: thioredoxin domain-containing protein [Tepidiformaceae bacterium]|nr:thioredoxin domain-containing protein [Tepidiformaceae bacterium]